MDLGQTLLREIANVTNGTFLEVQESDFKFDNNDNNNSGNYSGNSGNNSNIVMTI